MGKGSDLPPERALRNSPQVEVIEFSQDQYDLKEQERPLKCVILCPLKPHVTLQRPATRNKRPLHHFTNMKYQPRIVHYLCDKSSSACQKNCQSAWCRTWGKKRKSHVSCQEVCLYLMWNDIPTWQPNLGVIVRWAMKSGAGSAGSLLPSWVCLYFTSQLRISTDKY